MIDSLLGFQKRAMDSKILEKLRLEKGNYSVLAFHRPSNVDDLKTLRKIMETLKMVSKIIPIVFPVHPRTEKMLSKHGVSECPFECTEPLGYLDFLNLMMNSKFVLTDSGGIQEETTVLKVPCITLRKNTERPVTIEEGTNILVGIE